MWLREAVLSRLVCPPLRCYVRYAPLARGKVVLARWLLAAYRSFPETRVARARPGARFRTVTDDVVQGYLYLFGIWEPNITDWVRRTLRPGDTFIDIGANIGYFTVLASRLVTSCGHVVAIEASPDFATAARANLLLNNCTNVRLVNIAASDHSGIITFYQPCQYNRGNTTSVPVGRGAQPRFSIHSKALHEILTRSELGHARLVKVDAEGSEYAVLRGLMPALSLMREDAELIVEINPNLLATQGETAAELVGMLQGHGFNLYRVDNSYCIPDYISRKPPTPPRRWRLPVTEMGDFIFSRRDAESL